MNLINTFEPPGGPPTIKSIYMPLLVVFLFTAVPVVILIIVKHWDFYYMLCPVIVCLLVVMTTRTAVHVTISVIDNTFTYRTMNWLGNEKDTIVNLSTAKITYKYTRIMKDTKGWRLRLYNSYFRNRITLKENFDFTQQQMDQMVDLINECRGISSFPGTA